MVRSVMVVLVGTVKVVVLVGTLGIAIRAATIRHVPPINFILVTMGSTSILLIGWRTLLLSIFLMTIARKMMSTSEEALLSCLSCSLRWYEDGSSLSKLNSIVAHTRTTIYCIVTCKREGGDYSSKTLEEEMELVTHRSNSTTLLGTEEVKDG
ncbi:hypothetical protein RJ639_038354 [Escallonia herrerae]|uniref:Uncharacterized protein n=1 Tax=Escallonia herrerae TaxID=1293975 RepID=A0AA88WLS6_9ASTE|nr:hypothetical protein RJ639_038354 [Escallonia herrerae]